MLVNTSLNIYPSTVRLFFFFFFCFADVAETIHRVSLKINFSISVWLFLTDIFEPQIPHLQHGNHILLSGAGSQHGSSHPWQRSCGEAWYAKASQDSRAHSPRPAWASTPKPESVRFTISRLSPTLLTLTGGYPRPPFSEENQLRALVNKSPGHNRSVSIQTPLLTF